MVGAVHGPGRRGFPRREVHVEAFGFEQALIEKSGKGAVEGFDQNGAAADLEGSFQLREEAIGMREVVKTVLAVKGPG
ncbi:hypothetical protein D3C71_2001100 [compost metagenome]